MASTRAVPLVTTGGVALVIRAPLSTHDDTDSDISPVYSDASQNSFHSLSDEETVTVASASTLDASSVRFARIPSMPVAKITGDDETESTDEEEVEKDAFFGVAKVAGLNDSEKRALEEGESSNNHEIPVTPDGMENESINTEYYSFNSDQDNFGTNAITNSQDLNEKIDASILN